MDAMEVVMYHLLDDLEQSCPKMAPLNDSWQRCWAARNSRVMNPNNVNEMR
jgi:hypothetical protein